MIYNICYGIGGSAFIALCFFFFCYAKKFTIAQKILSVYVFLGAGAITILLLSLCLPDARNLFTTTITAAALASIGYILSLFPGNKVCRHLGRIFFLSVAAVWISLYYTTFYLFHIPLWITVISVAVYFSILVTILIILKNKSIGANFWITLSLILVSFLNHCGFITMCFSTSLYSIILFAGTLLFFFGLIYFVFEYGKINLKYAEPTKLILLTLSQSLIASAGVLLFSL